MSLSQRSVLFVLSFGAMQSRESKSDRVGKLLCTDACPFELSKPRLMEKFFLAAVLWLMAKTQVA